MISACSADTEAALEHDTVTLAPGDSTSVTFDTMMNDAMCSNRRCSAGQLNTFVLSVVSE